MFQMIDTKEAKLILTMELNSVEKSRNFFEFYEHKFFREMVCGRMPSMQKLIWRKQSTKKGLKAEYTRLQSLL